MRWVSRLFDWAYDHWCASRRRIDLKILWPSCKEAAGGDLDHARALFAVHAYSDPAWNVLGTVVIHRIIDGLE
jgi:hypothetical protein